MSILYYYFYLRKKNANEVILGISATIYGKQKIV